MSCCYIVIYMFMQHHNDTIIKTDARRKTQEDFFNKVLPLTLLQGFEKVVWGFTVRGSWRSIITAIFWPQSYDRLRCVFLVLQGCSTRGPGPTLLGNGFLYCILSASSSDLNSSGPKGPFGLVWLSLPHFVSNCLELQLRPIFNSTATGSSNSTELYNRSTPTRSLKSNVKSSSSGNNCHA